MVYKEIKYSENQKGWGLAVTNPATGTRALVGIFPTIREAREEGKRRRILGAVKRPRVVPWNKETYNRYDWVFRR